MKFFWIELQNYRQYKGNVKIDFSTRSSKNLSVIQGVNGAGKTNLMNAITWCFYGIEEHLVKYKEKLGKVNESVLLSLNEGETASAIVRITMGESSPEFMIERECIAEKFNERITQREKPPKAWRVINNDWVSIKSPETMVRSLLPKQIHEFFFFDGERLDDFFQSESATNVKNAILEVSQIRLLELTAKHVSSVRNQIISEAKRKTPNLESLQKKVESIQKGKEFNENKINEVKSNLKSLAVKINENKEILRMSSQEKIKSLQEKRDLLEKQIKRNEITLENLRLDCNQNILSMGAPVILYSTVENTLKLVDEQYERGELPPKIRAVFLKELLERGECICDTDLRNNEKAKIKLLELLKQSEFSKIANQVTEGKYVLEGLINSLPVLVSKQNEIRQRISEIKTEIKEDKEVMNTISDDIQKFDIEEISKVESSLIELENQKTKFNQEEGVLRSQIQAIDHELKSLDTQLEKELKNNKEYSNLIEKRELCQNVIGVILEIKDELMDEVREKIETNTNKYFMNFIWKKEAFSEVTIDEDYQISVRSKHGSEVIGSLSAGERQVLALSFMSALRGVSGFSAPVIIDTPLGRLSGEPRNNIADLLPKYLEDTQITLLMTDEEYTERVRSRLFHHVGVEYKLEYYEDESRTKVVNYDE